MTLLTPLWLVGLLPWGAVVYWLMQRRRRPTGVPFVPLWRGPYHPPKPTRQFARPPLPLALVMLAMLLALIAAARPVMKDPLGRGKTPVPVVVDRGAGMTARGGARLEDAFRDFQKGLLDTGVSPLRNLELHPVPDAPSKPTDVSDLANPLPFPLTAADTAAAVSATASRLLNEMSGLVVVISDQTLGVTSDRLIQVPPPSAPFRNVGIRRIAARATPQSQVMVTIAAARGWNDPLRLIVSSDGVDTAGTVEAPPDGQERSTFVDVPRPGRTIEVRLDVSDDAPADDRAWLVREGAWPKVEARVPLPPALQRLLQSYSTTRPSGEASPRVLIVSDSSEAKNVPAVVLPARRDGKSADGATTVSPHPITGEVDFSSIGEATVVSDPPAGWTPVVRRGGDVWVAVREAPAREVWVGFDAPDWGRTPQFVIFWASVFDWLGGVGEEAYTAIGVGELGPEWVPFTKLPAGSDPKWWPGLHKRADGAMRATNAPVVAPGPVAETDWRRKLQLLRQADQTELASHFLLAALGCALVAAAAWKRASLTEISGKTTVAADGVLTEARAARAEATRSRFAPTDSSG